MQNLWKFRLILHFSKEESSSTQSQLTKEQVIVRKEQGEQSTSNLRHQQNDTHWGYEDYPWKHLQRQQHHQKTRTRLRKEPKSMSTISQAKTQCIAITDGNDLKREMVDWKVSQNTLARIKGRDT